MSKDKEIVDLVPGEGGVYTPKGGTHHSKPQDKPKKKNDNMKQLFEGMDLGLDFVEGMSKRIGRLLKLKD